MLKKFYIDYFNNKKNENIKFWRRLGGKPNLKDKSILDFGCGIGSLCVDMANSDVNMITGIDLEDEFINFAKENLNNNYNHLTNKISFEKKDLLKDKFKHKFDLIVSKDTFEHTENLPEILNKFYDLLEINGKAYVGFGPLYNSYNGDHGRAQLKFPWLHVILSDKFIVNRYNKKNVSQISKIEDLGLSKYSFNDYKKIFNNSNFKIEFFITNQSDHPVSKVFNFFSKFKFLEEFFTYNIYCILKK
jgi:SAM-dependent methyltransferase